ncbi:MAG: hypothetical protein IT366_09660 [Candidatus Hydrogenedentes bacterium]|nr:hypothetical protein [Candidatus Hydrogenedentota bacterium]
MTVQCCKCKRLRALDQWSAPLPALLQGDVSHTYCPDCADHTYIELFSAQASKSTEREALFLRDQIALFA